MVYCFDLDNTLCQADCFAGAHRYMDAVPFVERIDVVNRLYDQGHIILIDTCRGSGSGVNWFQDTLKQLVGWGLRFHALRTAADCYVNDKATKAQEFFNSLDGVVPQSS